MGSRKEHLQLARICATLDRVMAPPHDDPNERILGLVLMYRESNAILKRRMHSTVEIVHESRDNEI